MTIEGGPIEGEHKKLKAKVLSLQPYYGGSHRQFIDGWMSHSRHQWGQLTLPGRHWKWRMRHSAIHFAKSVDQLWHDGERPDLLFTTDMLNVAEFLGLLKSDAKNVPTVVYFHENQFAYPSRKDRERDLSYAFTNLTSALAATSVWFNSVFNRDSFAEKINYWNKIWPDHTPTHAPEDVLVKSSVLSPGIDCSPNAKFIGPTKNRIDIVWAARWEHDKNPELLYQILHRLENKNTEFGLSVVGQQYREQPAAFNRVKERFGNQILNWGFIEDRKEYRNVLKRSDIFLSTADHEFFGLSVAESIAEGCIPVLPNRLSYPEILDVESHPERRALLFNEPTEAVEIINSISKNQINHSMIKDLTKEIRMRFGWRNVAEKLDFAVENVVHFDNESPT